MTKHISCSILLTTIIAIAMTLTAFSAPAHSLSNTLTLDVITSNETSQTTVTISGQLNVSSMPVEGAHIGIAVGNTNGTYIFADDVVTNSTGGYSTLFRLDSSRKGTYEVFASAYTAPSGNLLTTKYFSIGVCLEHWVCDDWSQCKTNLRQTRTCTDSNQCGTQDIIPPLSRSCTPTCQMLAGEICDISQSCSSTFIDASDTERCCDGSCRSEGGRGSSSGSRTTITEKAPYNKTTTAANSSSTSSGGSAASRSSKTADVPKEPKNNSTTAVQDNKTQGSTSNENALQNEAGRGAGMTVTGRVIGALNSNRWLIIDAILIIFILIFGSKLFPGKFLGDNQDNHGTAPRTSGRDTGFRQYHKTPEFVYNYNPSAQKKNISFPKQRPDIQQGRETAYNIKKIRVSVSSSPGRFGRR